MEGKPSLNWINFDAKTINQLMDRIANDPNFTGYAVAAAIVVVILTLLLLKHFTRKSSYGRSVLLIGLSESGKTLLFCQLMSNQFVKTVTSMKHNESLLEVGKKSVYLVDLPGYDRLRMKYWDDFKNKALGIVFVVDSLQLANNIRDVADFLYTVLADPIVNNKRLPVLVACNKQDEAKAKSAKIMLKQVEKEIGVIRETRLAALGSTDSGSDEVEILGNSDKEFAFSDLRNSIEFVDCSCLGKDETQENQLDAVRQWMKRVA